MPRASVRALCLLAFAATATAFACDDDKAKGAEAPSCVEASLRRFDEARQCFAAAEVVPEVCLRSVEEIPSASIGIVCAFGPDGHVWSTTLRGDQDLIASGWRFTEHRTAGYKPIPVEMQATTEQTATCGSYACAPSCPGTPPRHSFCKDAGP